MSRYLAFAICFVFLVLADVGAAAQDPVCETFESSQAECSDHICTHNNVDEIDFDDGEGTDHIEFETLTCSGGKPGQCTSSQVLHTLPELGVFSLALKYRESRRTDEFGNQFRYKAAVNPDPNDGESKDGRWAFDVFFMTVEGRDKQTTSRRFRSPVLVPGRPTHRQTLLDGWLDPATNRETVIDLTPKQAEP